MVFGGITMTTHALTFAAADAANPDAMLESRMNGGYRKSELDRKGRPPRWLDCDADEFLRDLDHGRIQPPEPEPEPQTEGERLRRALRDANLSISAAAKRIGMHRY